MSLQGNPYYVQVSAYNMKGWGPAQMSVPACAVPSSKRTVLSLPGRVLPQHVTSPPLIMSGVTLTFRLPELTSAFRAAQCLSGRL